MKKIKMFNNIKLNLKNINKTKIHIACNTKLTYQ